MIPKKSAVIRRLTSMEIDILSRELHTNSDHWMNHPMEKTALDDGQSIIINWVTKINGNYQLQWTLKEKFPDTWKILESLCPGHTFGKIYWHCLPPGHIAKPHTDYLNTYIKDGNCFKRYNIFLDIPDNLNLFLDNDLVNPVEHHSYQYTIFDMAAIEKHSAVNNSSTNFYCMIIDILDKHVSVYKDLWSITNLSESAKSRISIE